MEDLAALKIAAAFPASIMISSRPSTFSSVSCLRSPINFTTLAYK